MKRPSERADGSNVIWVNFGPGRHADDWLLRMADQCEEQSRRATPRVAASLLKLAGAYREKAGRG